LSPNQAAQKLVAAVAVIALLSAAALPATRAAEPMPGAGPKGLFPDVSGSLVIVGGGGLPDVVKDRFLQLAGGKKARLVIIPTASAKADYIPQKDLKSYVFWHSQDVESVELLHTHSREQANNPAFVKPLTKATGVWLCGGDQSVLLKAYDKTLVKDELLNLLLKRNGVIGGTSAGASAMSTVMITGGYREAMVGSGFGLLPDVVIDQHFQNRNRQARLLSVLAHHPELLGLGIDEQTAVVIQGHKLTVLGNANVQLYPPSTRPDPSLMQLLKNGEEVDLNRVLKAALARAQPAAPPATAAQQVSQKPVGGPMAQVGTPAAFSMSKNK
jgi:cyanophycinase